MFDYYYNKIISALYLQVNAVSEWIIVIYLYEFTNNEREISIPHEAAEFIVSELVQVNPDNSWAMSALTFLLFKLNTLHKETLHWNDLLGKPVKFNTFQSW